MARTIADSMESDRTSGAALCHQASPLGLIMNPVFLNSALLTRWPWARVGPLRSTRDAGLSP